MTTETDATSASDTVRQRVRILDRGRGLTCAEVAAITGHHPRTIARWVRAGTVPGVVIGQRRITIFEADLDEFIDGCRIVSSGASA